MANKAKYLTVDQALELVSGCITNRTTIYNLFCKKKLTRHGPRNARLVDRNELLKHLNLPEDFDGIQGQKKA